MEMDQLRQVLLISEHKNFTRAAEACRLSQPALSRSIAKLEEELGQPMFERQSRRIELTEAGKLLVDRARQIIVLVEDTKSQICDDGQSSQLRVAAIPTIAPYYLPAKLKRFQASFPKAKVIVQEDTTENLLKKLADGAIDLAIAALPIEAKYLETKVLFDEELLLILPANHDLAKKGTIRINDIESLPFILLGEAHCLTDNIVSFCRQKSFHPLFVERTSQLAMVQELVALDHGISLIPAMARDLDTSKRRVYRSLSGEKPKRSVVVVSNPYRFQSKLQKQFIEMLSES